MNYLRLRLLEIRTGILSIWVETSTEVGLLVVTLTVALVVPLPLVRTVVRVIPQEGISKSVTPRSEQVTMVIITRLVLPVWVFQALNTREQIDSSSVL